VPYSFSRRRTDYIQALVGSKDVGERIHWQGYKLCKTFDIKSMVPAASAQSQSSPKSNFLCPMTCIYMTSPAHYLNGLYLQQRVEDDCQFPGCDRDGGRFVSRISLHEPPRVGIQHTNTPLIARPLGRLQTQLYRAFLRDGPRDRPTPASPRSQPPPLRTLRLPVPGGECAGSLLSPPYTGSREDRITGATHRHRASISHRPWPLFPPTDLPNSQRHGTLTRHRTTPPSLLWQCTSKATL